MRPGKELKRALAALLAALLLFVRLPQYTAGAEFSAPSGPEITPDNVVTTLFLNSREQEKLTAGSRVTYRFTPSADDEYIFRSFPAGDAPAPQLQTELVRVSDGAVLEGGVFESWFRVEAALQAGQVYELRMEALTDGEMAAEVMLDARGRSFDNPISLPEGPVRYAKTIVRPRDSHWFSFTAQESGWYMIRTETSGDAILDTYGVLTDADGLEIASNDDILFPGDGNFMIQSQLQAGQSYRLRVSAFSNLTGAYRLVVAAPGEDQTVPATAALSAHELTLDVGETSQLQTTLTPAGAQADVAYASSDSAVVSVEPDGTLRALSAGQAVVWAYALGGASDKCVVTVRPMAVTGLSFEEDVVTVRMNERTMLSPVIEPKNASNRTVYYESSDESVVTVDASGRLTGVTVGQAQIIASTQDGGFAAVVEVDVLPVRPVYRALVMGEQTYADGVRLGGVNTAQGVADMLRNQSIDGYAYEVTLLLDSTRDGMLDGIASAFGEAAETDVSLFYINCHGGYENGVAYLRLHDDSRVTAEQLEAALRDVPGKVVVILDFCQSGAFIGADADFERFSASAAQAFAGRTPFASAKYTVITSASASEDSYRRSFSTANDENSTAAIMARSLCEGAGWDLVYDRSVALKADADRSRQITAQEVYEYTRRRVMHYLSGSNVTQTVHIYPEGDQTVLFGRN